MWTLRRKSRGVGGGAALADRPTDSFSAGTTELLAEIERLTEANRTSPSHETEREILRLRNIAGIRRIEEADGPPEYPEPELSRLPEADPLPEIGRGEVTPGLLRAGILRDGCLLVRGLVPGPSATAFAEKIDRSFVERDRHDAGEPHDDGYYSEFIPDPRLGQEFARPWIKSGGGVLAVDSPMLCFEMLELFRDAGLPELVHGYLGEPPLITGQKTTLRKADPAVPGAWHQDGKFMGQVRALNLWLSLSRCGDEAPGLDIVPRRLEEFVRTETDEAAFNHMISQRQAEEAAGDTPILRPIFEPGDALFFDDLFLHKTGSDPAMPRPRYAIENWFFGASEFPMDYAPIAV
jgi:hypothetical protein